jgi:hypothetical protein
MILRMLSKNGISGIKHDPELERLQFSCQMGKPDFSDCIAISLN